MKKKKMDLSSLKVTSFTIEVDHKKEAVKGGAIIVTYPEECNTFLCTYPCTGFLC